MLLRLLVLIQSHRIRIPGRVVPEGVKTTRSRICRFLERAMGKAYCVDVAGFHALAFTPVSLFSPSSWTFAAMSLTHNHSKKLYMLKWNHD